MSSHSDNLTDAHAQPTEAQRLLDEINEHLSAAPMGRSYFALKAAGYSTFIARLEQGVGGKPETRKRVRTFMTKRAKKLGLNTAKVG